LMWDVATQGYCVMPDGSRLEFAPKDWFEVIQWIYDRVDGKPIQAQDVNLQGEPLLTVIVRYADTEHDNPDAAEVDG
jgi:hypothetical protein